MGRLVKRMRFWFRKTWYFRFDAVLVRQVEAAAVLGRQVKRLRFWFRKTWYCITDLATKERWYDVGDPTGKEGHSEDNQNTLGKIIKKQKNESIMIIKKK